MSLKQLLYGTFLVFVSGCASSVSTPLSLDASSVKSLLKDDGIYGIGCAGFHSRGKSMQRKLALQRAIDDVASQISTSVNSTLTTHRKVKSTGSSSSSNRKSEHKSNVKVSTKIVGDYYSKGSQICVKVKQSR